MSTLLPSLDSIEDLNGVTILATHEDGFGDTLQFMRYLPMLAERGARVLAWVPRPLARVVGSLPGVRVLSCIDGPRVPIVSVVRPPLWARFCGSAPSAAFG